MASRLSNALNLFIFISLLCLRIRAEEGNTGSVFFIDSTSQGFLRSSDLTSQALQEQYGPDGVAQQGMELFQMMLEMIFDPLQGAYQGQ
ncbi:hypothetical protein C5167_041401 [Papaver somniferum]|nr:hypothetical protein C5167_041401 [Papaver somniferum]